MKLNCLVMAGGQGTRFWPESTSKKPKQYLNLFGDQTLLQQTLQRFDGLVEKPSRYIVTVEAQRELIETYSDVSVIYEPAGRNTAPCILLSLAKLIAGGVSKDEVVAIVPADHVILNTNGFQKTLLEAAELSIRKGHIVTIGISPTFPHTGYGYIKRGDKISGDCYKVSEFKEKPDRTLATKYLKDGSYFWNAGMFLAPLEVLLREFEAHCPEIYQFLDDLAANLEIPSKLSEVYQKIPANSIDYAIMEKSKNVSVIKADFDWNDLGSWDALESVIKKQDENIVASDDGHYFKNATGNIIYCPQKFVSLINVDDLVVVSNDNAVVVFPKKDSQEVKSIVNFVKDNRQDLI